VAALDGLRAFAVIAVIVCHTLEVPWPFVQNMANAGWVGVDLFFVLSGFLITGILLDSKGATRFFRNFYIRRTLRIFPLYYAVLITALVIAPHVLPVDGGERAILDKQGWLWFYAQNIEQLRANRNAWHAGWLQLTHLWSLSVEEQFYVVWPTVVFLTSRRALVAVAMAIVVGAPLLRVALLRSGTVPECIYTFTPCRLDTLAVGALLAMLVRSRPELAPKVCRALLALGGAGVLAIAIATGGFVGTNGVVQTVGYSAVALLFGGVVLGAALPEARHRLLVHPILTTIGRYSYGIYLLSYVCDPMFQRIFHGDRVARLLHSHAAASAAFMIFEIAASTGLAAITWNLF